VERPEPPASDVAANDYLAFGVPTLGADEETAVLRVLRSGWIGTGPEVAAFEEEFAAAVGARHAVAVSSCTAGLHLALLAAGVGPGDEVVTSTLTFVATANAIVHAGARPVLVDVEPDTLNLDPAGVEAAIGARTRAILPVHFAGRPCAPAPLRGLAAKHGLAIVEDAAHAVGARHAGGRPVGSGADACFSFYPNKNLTSCEGGMITTRSAARARRYRRMRLHGLSTDAWKRYGSPQLVRSRMQELGFKYNLTDLQAAIGRVQLRRLENFTTRRNEQDQRYRETLAQLERLHAPPPLAAGRHAFHLFSVFVEGVPRDEALLEMRRRGVGAAIHYVPVHLQPWYRQLLGHAPGSFPVAERVGATSFSLPIGPSLGDAEVARVCDALGAVDRLARRAGSRGSARVSPAPCDRPSTTWGAGSPAARR
jgi:dTDP-4-amino-4,6-dideoxygalactose transaminase